LFRGVFTLNSDGTLYFSLPAPKRPVITSIVAGTGSASVTFNAVPGARYALYYGTNLAIPVSDWAVVPGSVTATGNSAILVDPSAPTDSRFYLVGALNP